MKYSGIDLHSNNSVVTVTDETDRVVAEKRMPNESDLQNSFCVTSEAEGAVCRRGEVHRSRPGHEGTSRWRSRAGTPPRGCGIRKAARSCRC